MKTFKYLFVGALMFGSSTVTVLAQTPNYKSLLEPIQNELKAQPGDANAANVEVIAAAETFLPS